MTTLHLLAVQVSRRTIAAVVFDGEHIEYAEVRHLASEHRRAEASALGFVQWLKYAFEVESLAIESLDAETQTRRRILGELIVQGLRREGVSVWMPTKTEILSAFAEPGLSSRRELREVVRSIWPVFDQSMSPLLLDAAALGLHVQIRRFLNP